MTSFDRPKPHPSGPIAMRRVHLSSLGIIALAVAGLGAAPKAEKLGDDPSYRELGTMAVQDGGRIKPLDSYARLRVKQVYTREIIKLKDDKGNVTAAWQPLAAMLDWRARPEFWNAQEIIAVEYLPLKQKLLSVPAREALAALARSGRLDSADRAVVAKLSEDPEVSTGDLQKVAAMKGLADRDRAELKKLAHKLSPDQKWLAPDDLAEGNLDVDGQRTDFRSWIAELNRRRKPSDNMSEGAEPNYSTLEQKALDAAHKLMGYWAIRDGDARGNAMYDLFVIPRPASPAYLGFNGAALEKVRSQKDRENGPDITPLEENVLRAMIDYNKDLLPKAQRVPGKDAEYDANYAEWLRDKAAWLPIGLVLEGNPAELDKAGLPEAKVVAFRKAFQGVIDGEKSAPGHLSAEAAHALVFAARDLGESISVPYLQAKDVKHKTWEDLNASRVSAFAAVRDALGKSSAPLSPEKQAELIASARTLGHGVVSYPSEAEMGRESTFNHLAPFSLAPYGYGIAVALLLICVGMGAKPGTAGFAVDRGLYVAGLAGLASGIALEIVGFYYRVRITGWAPVTNMYETVIWVALMTSVLGFVLELIYRKKFAALAASGVSLLATILAANVSLLDPDIKLLQPVLRSNYWLTIHVLTIVSSYAAFSLAMGLGLLGLGYYLSATYRNDASFARLAKPLIVGLPMLAAGIAGLLGSHYAKPGDFLGTNVAFVGFWFVAVFGGMIPTITATVAMLGEASNRFPNRTSVAGAVALALGTVGTTAAALTTTPAIWPDWLATWVVPAIVGGVGFGALLLGRLGAMARGALIEAEAVVRHEEIPGEFAEIDAARAESHQAFASSGNGGVATMAKPSVAEIRARESASVAKLDPRGQAIQATASRIKPLANFTYRAMQVGVLLVAAGTILGGVWADFSWGRFWGWDAKEVWALITLLVYLVPLHGRFAGWVNTFGLMAASVACYSSVLMAWYGVNFVLGIGLHSYGFVEGGGQGIVFTCSLAVLSLVFAAGWRRSLATKAA